LRKVKFFYAPIYGNIGKIVKEEQNTTFWGGGILFQYRKKQARRMGISGGLVYRFECVFRINRV
jgi:hypothetical protein